MIRRDLYIKKYDWQVHIFYRVTCYYTEEIIGLLKSIDCPKDKAREAYNNLVSCKLDTGVTYSNYKLRKSVMVISKTSSPEEFLNSLKHECRHLEDHIATAFKMPIGGEEVAYLAGYLGRMLYEDVQLFICDCRKHKREKLCVKRIKKK
jgi:hypothetical protein